MIISLIMNKNTITLSLSLILFSSFAVLAHDTTHIHPLITAKVAESIANALSRSRHLPVKESSHESI
jgi:hypothetical protein